MLRTALRIGTVLVLSAFATGCLGEMKVTQGNDRDDNQLRELLNGQVFFGTSFMRVAKQPYKTQLDPKNLIDVFVSQEAAPAYVTIMPEYPTATLAFPVGGVVVREV